MIVPVMVTGVMTRLRKLLWPLLGSCLVAGALAVTVVGSEANARTAYSSAYTLEQNYSAALRLIRVDMGLKITERDPESAYLMFDYKSSESGTRVTPGSIEMIPGENAVQIVVQLPQMPQYHEEVMANALRKKMQADYGEPPKQRGAPGNKRDAGADADAGADSGHDDDDAGSP